MASDTIAILALLIKPKAITIKFQTFSFSTVAANFFLKLLIWLALNSIQNISINNKLIFVLLKLIHFFFMHLISIFYQIIINLIIRRIIILFHILILIFIILR